MSENQNRFPEEVNRMLTEAGWYPRRNVKEQLKLPRDFQAHSAAMQVLAEFGNLKIGERGPGIECARSRLDVNPYLADGEADRFQLFEGRISSKLYPLGEGDDGHYFLAITPMGHVYLVMDFLMFVANSFDQALVNLLLGRKAQIVE